MFDPILKRFATAFPHVTLQYDTELVGFEDRGTHVRGATVRDTRTGETREIAADYLVGTDGGATFVRERLGITMSGNPALTYTTNVIFRCPDFARCTTRAGPTASSSSGRRAPGSPSWRSTAPTASACRSSARPTR